MNPNYLSKDELSYELGIRGIVEDTDTQNLRKLFRRVLTRELPLQWDFLTPQRTEELYSVISTKVHELQEWLTRESPKPTDFASRVKTRVRHLKDRLAHLTAAGLCTSNQELEVREALLSQLSNLESLTSAMLTDAHTHSSSLITQDNEMEPNPHTEGTTKLQQSVQSSLNDIGLRLENYSLTAAQTSQNFQKLPNPASYLLKKLPIVDGNDAFILCEFLLKVMDISVLGHIQASDLFEILHPYCRGEMLTCVVQAIADKEGFESFHERIIKRFIPTRQFSFLRNEWYERVQRSDESLDQYVRAIREAATVLRIKEGESEVVARIVEGFHPDQRARLVFQAPPSTFRELELLTIVDRNIAFADHLRASSAGQSTVNTIHQRTQRPSQQTSNVMVKQSTKSGNRPVCFYCSKPGHFQRNCHLRRSSNYSTHTSPRTQS